MDKIFIPKKVIENGIEYILFDDVFRREEIISYALIHNYPIKFICTSYTCACEILAEIQENDYSLIFKKVPIYMQGLRLDDKIEVFCEKIVRSEDI